VLTTVEQPPGGGPVVAAAAGLALLDQTVSTVALLAADLPFLTPEAIRHLIATLDGAPAADGAIYVDAARRPQWLCGVWRHASLRRRLDEMGERLDGAPLRTLLMPLAVVQVTADAGTPPPFFDCDTDADVRRAEEWWDDAR
jgi:molybdopterin-guanine dinucleotide biosynthesis protein A